MKNMEVIGVVLLLLFVVGIIYVEQTKTKSCNPTRCYDWAVVRGCEAEYYSGEIPLEDLVACIDMCGGADCKPDYYLFDVTDECYIWDYDYNNNCYIELDEAERISQDWQSDIISLSCNIDVIQAYYDNTRNPRCNTPTTSIPEPNCIPSVCSQNSGYFGDAFCSKGDVYRRWFVYDCYNDECVHWTTHRIMIEDCGNYDCQGGVCVLNPITSTVYTTTVKPTTSTVKPTTSLVTTSIIPNTTTTIPGGGNWLEDMLNDIGKAISDFFNGLASWLGF